MLAVSFDALINKDSLIAEDKSFIRQPKVVLPFGNGHKIIEDYAPFGT